MFNPGHMPANLKKDVTGLKKEVGKIYTLVLTAGGHKTFGFQSSLKTYNSNGDTRQAILIYGSLDIHSMLSILQLRNNGQSDFANVTASGIVSVAVSKTGYVTVTTTVGSYDDIILQSSSYLGIS